MRKCYECGLEIKASDVQGELAQFSDHSTTHNASPAQWTEAWKRMQAAKDKQHKADKFGAAESMARG